MPRNSSGTYSLPSGNPVVSNTLIQSTWANTTMSDLGASVTDSLDRSGRGAMLAPLKNTDGTQVAPSMTFSSEGTLGIYRASAGVLGFVAGGVLVLSLSTAGLVYATPLIIPTGTAAAPALAFVSNTNTGIYSPGTSQVSISTAGVDRLAVNATGSVSLSTGALVLAAAGANSIAASNAVGTLALQTGGFNTRFSIDAAGAGTFSGNLGVGTVPAVKFHVVGADVRLQDASLAFQVDLQPNITTGEYRTSAFIVAGSFMTFYTNPNAGGTAERMRIDAAGNVGIGRVSGGSRLDVAGNILTGNAGGGFDGFIAQSTNSVDVRFFANGGSSNGFVGTNSNHAFYVMTNAIARLNIDTVGVVGIGNVATTGWGAPSNLRAIQYGAITSVSGDSGSSRFMNNSYVDSGGAFRAIQTGLGTMLQQNGGATYWNTAPSVSAAATQTYSTVMYLDASGNLALGTTSPSAKLDVRGNIAAITTAANTPVVTVNKSDSGTPNQNGGALQLINLHANNTARAADVLAGKILWQFSQPTSGGAQDAAAITVASDGSQGGANTQSYMAFLTAGVGGGSAAERMRISASGTVIIPGLIQASAGEALRVANDAGFISFYNTANTTRTGYLQGGAGVNVVLSCDVGALNLTGASNVVLTATTGTVQDKNGLELGWKDIPPSSQAGPYTLVLGDRGKMILVGATSATVPASVFSSGAAVTIYNNSAGSISIIQGASVTMYYGATGATGNRTLGTRGICTVVCLASNTFVVTGAGLT